MIGNDIDGIDGGYKIHVLYNLTAKPSNKQYSTITPNPNAFEFSWELSSVPVEALDLRPTSHIIFDTTKMHEGAIYEVEKVIYGTNTETAKILSIDEFEEMTNTASNIDIVDHGDGTWSATGSDYYIKSNPGAREFLIKEANAVFLNPTTYNISSSE
jgi:hypothetical protein